MGKRKYNVEEYVGQKINQLTVLREYPELGSDGSVLWEFACDCGKTYVARPYHILNGKVKSCGCNRNKPKDNSKKYSKYIGMKSNRLMVIAVKKNIDSGRVAFECLCECGNITSLRPYQFISGEIQSCGCAKTGWVNETETYRKHGLCKDKFYSEWVHIKSRCYNEKADNYERYGGRGIYVCDEWLHDAKAFIEWCHSTKPKEGHYTLDRIDNDGPYAPWNCRWATNEQQARNKRSTVLLTYNGETKCLTDWAIQLKANPETIRGRLARGWSIEKAVSTPINKDCRNGRYKGERFTPNSVQDF